MALSADGNTAIIGQPWDDGGIGAAWIWTRSGGTWTQGPKLIGSGATGNASQGHSVALSADGNTALVGGSGDNGAVGAVWVWTRNAGIWTQQGTKLVGSGAVDQSFQGFAVDLSADGNTALVGGYSDNLGVGAVWIFTRSAGTWTQQGTKLIGSGAAGNAKQGWAVALSSDGNTALVGGYNDNAGIGASWIWTRSGGVWTQQGAKLAASDAVGTFVEQGFSVSLSGDGNTALIGGIGDNGFKGAAWVWTRTAGLWTQQGPKLVGSGAVGNANQGTGVALSGDGNIALVGGYADNGSAGATWVWTRRGSSWFQKGAKLVGSGAQNSQFYGGAHQGSSVAIASDGRTALVGAANDNQDIGAAWAFTGVFEAILGDFDGDLKSDRTIFRPGTGAWYQALSGGGARVNGWGVATDIDVAADYDGDGKVDIAVYRPTTGQWFIIQSATSTVRIDAWGSVPDDIPLTGDVDGDSRADLIIFRPSIGAWFTKTAAGAESWFVWGQAGDKPLLADFDGDGKPDYVVFRPSTGNWYALLSGGGGYGTHWGEATDIPVAGDWDGDGKADVAIFRPSTGQWWIAPSRPGGPIVLIVGWGAPGDIPISGDQDGDGISDYAIWRPSTGVWYTFFSAGGAAAVQWGEPTDRPIGRLPGT